MIKLSSSCSMSVLKKENIQKFDIVEFYVGLNVTLNFKFKELSLLWMWGLWFACVCNVLLRNVGLTARKNRPTLFSVNFMIN